MKLVSPCLTVSSQTCKRLRQATEEHQTWLCQAKRLQIPIPNGPNPSKAELKDLVISRARVDTCWIKRRSGYLRPRELTANAPLISSHYLPGGNFVVLLYESGSIDLREVQGEDAGGWNLVRVARYEQRDVHDRPAPLSELLTKTSYGSPVLAYTNEAGNKYVHVSWTRNVATADCEIVGSSFSSLIISHKRLRKSKSWISAITGVWRCGRYWRHRTRSSAAARSRKGGESSWYSSAVQTRSKNTSFYSPLRYSDFHTTCSSNLQLV